MAAVTSSRRCYILSASIFLLVLFLSTARYTDVSIPVPRPQQEAPKPPEKPAPEGPNLAQTPACIPELQTLKNPEYRLNPNINYVRRCIKPKFDDTITRQDRGDGRYVDKVVNVSGNLITEKIPVNLESCETLKSISCDTLELPVQRPYPEKKFDHLLFSVATTYKRLRESLSTFEHWLSHTGAALIALVVDQPEAGKPLNLDFQALVQEYADAGIKMKIVMPHDPRHTVPQSHMMMIQDMLDYIDAENTTTQWLGVLDDDTFFPSLHALSDVLAQYDHTVPAYLGAISENLNQAAIGLGAFGGAGIFLSVPLARQIAPFLESCLTERGGDMQIMECIHNNTPTRLQQVQGLQQQDFHGDPSGFFESGWRFISLHHFKSWYFAPVKEMAAVVDVCGDCFLQRYSFDDNTVLANGYSISIYPNGYPDLTRMEGTWDKAEENRRFQWSLGPLRPRMSPENKQQYRLVDAFRDANGALRQIFVRRGNPERHEVDEVIDFIWKVD